MAQLNVRVPDELLERLKAESKRRGEPASAVVRDAIEAKLPAINVWADVKPMPADMPDLGAADIEKAAYRQARDASPDGTVDVQVEAGTARPPPNAFQLSTRTGMPKAICQRMIDEGRVSVGADGRWLLDGKAV